MGASSFLPRQRVRKKDQGCVSFSSVMSQTKRTQLTRQGKKFINTGILIFILDGFKFYTYHLYCNSLNLEIKVYDFELEILEGNQFLEWLIYLFIK